MFGFKDALVILAIIGAIAGMIYLSEQEDKRPDKVRWIEDIRNGCKLVETIPLANDMVHIRKSEYVPKLLKVYNCKSNLKAATIEKQ